MYALMGFDPDFPEAGWPILVLNDEEHPVDRIEFVDVTKEGEDPSDGCFGDECVHEIGFAPDPGFDWGRD